MLRATFAARVRELRKHHGWSLSAFGRRFTPPVSAVHVHHLESGSYNPTVDHVEKVAAAGALDDPLWLLR